MPPGAMLLDKVEDALVLFRSPWSFVHLWIQTVSPPFAALLRATCNEVSNGFPSAIALRFHVLDSFLIFGFCERSMVDLRIAAMVPAGADLGGHATREFVRDHTPLLAVQGNGLVELGFLGRTPKAIHLCQAKLVIRNCNVRYESSVILRMAMQPETGGYMRKLLEIEVMMMQNDFYEALVSNLLFIQSNNFEKCIGSSGVSPE
jgi:hypothetical protein